MFNNTNSRPAIDRRFFKRSFLEKICDALFLETNILRTMAILWFAFCTSMLVGGIIILAHFIHKYW